MLPAQRHHKVPRELEGLEDVLTTTISAFLRSLVAGLLIKRACVPLQAVGEVV